MLSEEMLKAIAARLEDESRDVRQAAVDALITQSRLPLISSQYAKSFFRVLQERSFSERVTWLVIEDISYIALGHKIFRFEGWPDRFTDAIRESQRDLGMPI